MLKPGDRVQAVETGYTASIISVDEMGYIVLWDHHPFKQHYSANWYRNVRKVDWLDEPIQKTKER